MLAQLNTYEKLLKNVSDQHALEGHVIQNDFIEDENFEIFDIFTSQSF